MIQISVVITDTFFLKQSRQKLLQLGGRFGTFDALKHSLHVAEHNSGVFIMFSFAMFSVSRETETVKHRFQELLCILKLGQESATDCFEAAPWKVPRLQ